MRTQKAVNINGKISKRVILIEEYYKASGSTMPFKDFEAICKTPFLHIRRKLANSDLYEIRFKYLGKFIPVPSNVVWLLKHSTKRFKEKLIEEKNYKKTIEQLTNYIKLNPKKFERFKEQIKPFL
jgi:hypothetical protein